MEPPLARPRRRAAPGPGWVLAPPRQAAILRAVEEEHAAAFNPRRLSARQADLRLVVYPHAVDQGLVLPLPLPAAAATRAVSIRAELRAQRLEPGFVDGRLRPGAGRV